MKGIFREVILHGNKIVKSKAKISKKQFISLLDDVDKRENEQLKNDINDEFNKDFDSIDWDKVTKCMQSIIAIRGDNA